MVQIWENVKGVRANFFQIVSIEIEFLKTLQFLAFGKKISSKLNLRTPKQNYYEHVQGATTWPWTEKRKKKNYQI